MAGGHNPLDQFKVKQIGQPIELFGYDISFSNSALFMFIAIFSAIIFFNFCIRKKAVVPGRMQSIAEVVYLFIANLVKDNVGSEGRKYFSFIFSLFIFILFCNVLGLFPYSFTVTSHLIVTFAIAFFIFISVTIIGFAKHGLRYFRIFLPGGVPWWLSPIMVVIELISYFSRPISLSVRLAANMTIGHVLLKVVAGFIVAMSAMFAIFPFAILLFITAFELFIAILHAYIFTLLACIYLNDAIDMH